MAVYSFLGFSASQLENVLGGGSFGVGDDVVLDSSWSSGSSAYTFEFDDNDTTIDGDYVSNESGDDFDVTLTVTDENSTTVGSGQGYLENRYTLSGPGGEIIYLYAVEIGGVTQGYIVDGEILPGVHYEVTAVDDVDWLNAPDYSDIDSQTYDSTLANDISGGTGDESIVAGMGNDTVSAGDGSDTILGGGGIDTIYGEGGADSVLGGSGDDSIDGGAGNDTLDGGTGNDSIFGGLGDDSILGGLGNDTLDGGDGADTIYVGDGANVASGGAGNDLIDDAAGSNYTTSGNIFYGGTGDDTLLGSDGADSLYGEDDNVSIVGNGGADLLSGGAGHDTLEGGTGADHLYGWTGDDSLVGGTGNDVLAGGEGIDTLDGGAGADWLSGGTGADNISGGSESDTIFGGAAADTISGDAGADYIEGGTGDDSILGGDDADTIYAGSGSDTVLAGDGDDVISDWGTTSGGSGMTGDTYTVINLGNIADLDPTEYAGVGSENYGAENASAALGTYGDTTNPLSDAFCTMQAPTATSTENGNPAITTDSTGDPADSIYIDDLELQIDSVFVFDATITYSDLTTASVTIDVFQTSDGTLYLAPQTSQNADQLALEAKPIQSITLDTVVAGDGTGAALSLEQDRWDAEFVTGGGGDDLFDGGAGNDSISGYIGDDTLLGGDGADTISAYDGADSVDGGAGDDIIWGDKGDDTLTGGTGEDTFGFSNGFGSDTITDFDLGDDDLDGFTNDQLDLTFLNDDEGNPVNISDVVVSDDGFGNAMLSFPNGETIVLSGIAPSAVSDGSVLHSMGVPCFVSGTLIETPDGEVPVEDLEAGDHVSCADGSIQPIVWAGGRVLKEEELNKSPELRPIVLKQGVIGNRRQLRLSPQHAVSVTAYGKPALARAAHLAERDEGAFRIAKGVKSVGYHHILLPEHAMLIAEGAIVESLWPGRMAMRALGFKSQLEIAVAMPKLIPAMNGEKRLEQVYGPRAHYLLKRAEVVDLPEIKTMKNSEFDQAGKEALAS